MNDKTLGNGAEVIIEKQEQVKMLEFLEKNWIITLQQVIEVLNRLKQVWETCQILEYERNISFERISILWWFH